MSAPFKGTRAVRRVRGARPFAWDQNASRIPTRSCRSLLSSGKDLDELAVVRAAGMEGAPPGGWWMEAVVPDYRQVLYGYYHNARVER